MEVWWIGHCLAICRICSARCVFAYDWVEKQRLMRGLEDHGGPLVALHG